MNNRLIRRSLNVWMAFAALVGATAVLAQGALENPAADSFQSGIATFSGWNCDAERIELEIDGGEPLLAAYGTSRNDTSGICGDADNGFGLLFNMALLDTGSHEVVAFADGVEFARNTFNVTRLSTGEFLTGASAEVTVPDFPEPGKSVTLVWQQSNQNFLISSEDDGSGGGDDDTAVAKGPRQTIFDDGEVDSLANAGIAAFDEAIGFASCGGNGEDCPSVGWGMVSDSDRGMVLEVTHSGAGLAGLFFSIDPFADFTAFDGGTVSFDVLVVDEGSNTSGFTAKVDCIFPCTSGDQAIGVIGLGGWETVTMDVTTLVGGGLDLTKVNTGFVIFPNAGEQTGVVYRLDNVFWQTP